MVKAWLKKIVKDSEKKFLVACAFLMFIFLIQNVPSVISWGPSSNNENYSVRSTVNVTNAYPEILNIICNSDSAIVLNAGTTQTVTCIVEIRDYNGGDDVNATNATFYHQTSTSASADDNNTHYSNTTCTLGTPNGYNVNATCNFDLYYYADNGTWRMNATVNDSYASVVDDYENYTVGTLFALNVTNVIDFGDMYVGETSATSIEANVTNFGNQEINVSVYGFGGDDSVVGDGVAMLCDQRNISLDSERYSLNSGDLHSAMTPITGTPVTVPSLRVVKQTVPNSYKINSTYWRIHINVSDNPFGICNGTVVFAAEVP